MSNIPDEMYREILTRVSVEDLFRLRSVCKTWRRIIDDPILVNSHIDGGKGQDWLILKPFTGGKVYLFPLKEMVSEKVPSVKCVLAKNVINIGLPQRIPVPSCNGLVLISSCDKNNMFWRIWNPFTGESLELDGFTNDACRIPYCGIGYDKDTKDYKVVMINEFHTYIYSVNSKIWRRIEDFPFSGFGILEEDGVFAYGALHWLAYSNGENGHRGLVSVVALDLSTEMYRMVPVPLEMAELRWYSPTLVTLNEGLFISACLSGNFVVWMIKSYGCENTWVKIISMEGEFYWTPIAYLKSKERILLHRKNYNQICCWYDLVKKCTEPDFLVVMPKTNNLDKYRLTKHPFSCQVLSASLYRLMQSYGANDVVASEATSKTERKRIVANERLPLEIVFGDHEGSMADD